MGRVEGKIAVVSGAGTGIGLAAAKRLAEEGAKVTIAEFDEESGRQAAWIDGRFKLVARLGRDPQLPPIEHVELFDLVADPAETRDLSAGEQDRVTAMRAALDAWRRAIRERP